MAGKGEKPDWLDEEDLFEDDEVGKDELLEADDVIEKQPMLKRGGAKREEAAAPEKPSERRSGKSDDKEPEPKASGKDAGKPGRAARSEREIRNTRALRPGEQEVTKSPLVLILSGTILVLALLCGIYWFTIGRDTLTRQLMAIDEQVNAQQYAGAIASLEQFIIDHPKDKLADKARIKLGKLRIDAAIGSAVPDWAKGMDSLNKMLTECREVADFSDENGAIADYAKRIALGALDTSAKQKDPSLLKIADEASVVIEKYSEGEKAKAETATQLKIGRELADAAILKNDTLKASYAEIDRFVKESKPIEALASRRRLLDRYPDFEKDRKVVQLLNQTLTSEQNLVKAVDANQQAVKEDRPQLVPKPLVLSQHTRVRTDETSEGRAIWGFAQGCVYGVDTTTGDTLWRRALGLDSPFFPVSIETAVPALICFDTRFNEVVCLNRLTGELIWRQPLGEAATGQPLIHQSQIYVSSVSNSLFRLDVQTGEITRRLTFSQPIVSPLVLLQNGTHLLAAGREAVTYTLTLTPLQCVKVSFTNQRPGAVQVPLVAMGSTVLMIENDRTNSANLRVLDATKSETGLPELDSLRLIAHAKDRTLLRGNQLFIAAERELLSVYTVSDDPEQKKLSPLAKPPTQTDYTGPIYLHAGPDGRLWVVSDNIKQFQLTTETLGEDTKKRIFIGAAGQPIQSIGKTLFVGRKQLESDSVAVLQVDGEDMISAWRTVVGCGLLTMTAVSAENTICVTKSGDVFQITVPEVEAGGFKFRSETTLKLAEGNAEPLEATPIGGGKIAVTCGGKEPKLWVLNPIGKVEAEVVLDGSPVGPPVPLAGGVVVPFGGKLRTLAVPNVSRVDDYLAAVSNKAVTQAWTTVMSIDATHLAVIDAEGKLSRLEYRAAPKPGLQQLESIAIGQSVDVQPLLDKGRLIVTDASGRLQIVNANGFERLADAKLENPAVGKLALAGTRLLVTTAADTLECYDTANLKKLWSMPSSQALLADAAILEKGNLVVALTDGRVLSLKPDTGEVVKSVLLDHSIESGPTRIGKFIVVGTVDGSIQRIDGLVGGS